MPFIDLAFRLKPVGQVVSVFVTTLMPKFMRSPGNLLFKLAFSSTWRIDAVFFGVFDLFI